MASVPTTADLETVLPSIDKRPTFLVHRINAELARVCNPLFRRLNVDLITSRILVILLEHERAYVGDIVDLMTLPQSTVSHQLKRLQDAGLVVRKADPADQRAFRVSLTKKGRAVAAECDEISRVLYARLFDDFDEGDMQHLAASLDAMVTRLKSLSPRAVV